MNQEDFNGDTCHSVILQESEPMLGTLELQSRPYFDTPPKARKQQPLLYQSENDSVTDSHFMDIKSTGCDVSEDSNIYDEETGCDNRKKMILETGAKLSLSPTINNSPLQATMHPEHQPSLHSQPFKHTPHPSNNNIVNSLSNVSNKKVNWRAVFIKYAESTTFHGLKNVVENQVFLLRRLIWLLLFCGGMVIFLMQMITSIQYYASWPVTVDVKINYNDTIGFPAVTICNGNAFRTTETYKSGFYHMLSQLYGSENISSFKISDFDVEDVNLDQLYRMFGHKKEDLIVSCEWKESPCSAEDDFVVTITDYGMCYTFNSGRNGSIPRMVHQTGAEGGLRLQLNIEQYQYMRGPNEGAGLKILVHNQNDIPLVRDHGLAVPPGHHGLVAIKTVQVNNLKPNHGKCSDDINLKHFKSYTFSSCLVNCKEMYLIEACGCRDIYMPDQNTSSSVCNIHNYTTCMAKALESFREQQGNCTCPIPCHRSLYEPYMSYAATSNFDIDTLLRKNSTHILRTKYVNATETTQRVNKAIIDEDTELITTLKETVYRLDTAFKDINKSLDITYHSLHKEFEIIQKRIHYHIDRGLEAVKFTIEHDFLRGWEVFNERSFHFVTMDFIDVAMQLKRTVENAHNSPGEPNVIESKSGRYMIYSPIQNMFMGRNDSAERARVFLNQTIIAFETGDPLLTYKSSYNRRYDMSYIYLPLIQSGKDRMLHYDELIEAIDRMNLGLTVLSEVGYQFVESGYFNESHFAYGDDRFQSACRQFNYRIYMFETRVILIPLEVITERLEDFKILNRTLHTAHENVQIKILQISNLLKDSIGIIWQQIINISVTASEYLNQTNTLKTPLSLEVTSKELQESIRSLSVFFTDIRSRVRELQDGISTLQLVYKDMWSSMLMEESTKAFYEMEYNDSQNFLINDTHYDEYIKIFRYMLRTETPLLQQQTKEEIVHQINGDFHGMDVLEVLDDIDRRYQNISQTLDLSSHIGDSDELFLVSFERFRQSMESYLSHNEIDSSFYKENFMRLDVFMQELSYEEITQQKGYEITQLLSDIGGSMGLFIGGSVLSIFEFFDIFIHHGARIALNR